MKLPFEPVVKCSCTQKNLHGMTIICILKQWLLIPIIHKKYFLNNLLLKLLSRNLHNSIIKFFCISVHSKKSFKTQTNIKQIIKLSNRLIDKIWSRYNYSRPALWDFFPDTILHNFLLRPVNKQTLHSLLISIFKIKAFKKFNTIGRIISSV